MTSSRRKQPTSPKAPAAPKAPKRPPGIPKIPGIKKIKGFPGLKPFPGSSSASPGPVDLHTLALIQDALACRRPIMGTYGKKYRELSPLAIGTKDGEHHLWAYQFGGESDDKCKCFVVAKLNDAALLQKAWQAPASDPGPASCIDTILHRVSVTGF